MELLETDDLLLRSIARKVRLKPSAEPRATEAASLPEWRMPGFCGQSKVLTSFGALPIEALRRNDPVKTHDGRYLKVLWVDRVMFDRDYLEAHPEAYPVRVPMGTLGPRLPHQDMMVSPAQPMHTAAHHGRPTFYPASEAVGKRGVARKAVVSFTYYLFGCSDACAVCIDGIWCQTPKSGGVQDI